MNANNKKFVTFSRSDVLGTIASVMVVGATLLLQLQILFPGLLFASVTFVGSVLAFIDMAIKRAKSGMIMQGAFAVIALVGIIKAVSMMQ